MSQFAKIHNLHLVATAVDQLKNRAIGLPGFAVIYGPAGWSKSTSLMAAAMEQRGYYVQMRSAWSRKALLEKILTEMSIRPGATIPKQLDQVCAQLAASGRPLMLDEFDHCVKSDNMVELVRDIYEGSQSTIVLAGEEMLPQKLERWERFHSRVLSWIPAQPVSLADAKELAKVYCKQLTIKEDLLQLLVDRSHGSIRRVCVNLANIENHASLNGWKTVGADQYDASRIFTGEAPRRAA